jgi:hypothetical protein
MRFKAWLAAGKLTLLSRSSTTSRTTDGEYLSWARVFFHGGSGSVAPASLNRRYAIAHRALSWNRGGVSLLLAEVGRFPLEKARLFGVLPAAAYWQSACQLCFVALPIGQSLKNRGKPKPQFLHIQLLRLLPGSSGSSDSAHRLIGKILIDVLFAFPKCE